MKQRPFGKTGWKVSEIGFGCWAMGGGWGPRDDTEAKAAIRRALELGVDFFDTAFIYGEGQSEKLLGEALKGSSLPFRIATKVPAKTMEWPATPQSKIAEAFPVDWLVECTETSLKRLGVERIDLQQMHIWTDAWVEADEWREAADRLKKQGKIKAFGVSINDHQPDSALKVVAGGGIDSVQVIYNIFDQAPSARLFPLCEEHGVAVIARVPFDEGSLAGRLTPQTRFPKGDWRAGYFRDERLTETCERVEKLKVFLDKDTPTFSELALKFCLAHPAVSTVIPGMRKREHVEANCAVSGRPPLTAEQRTALKQHAWQRNFYQGAWD